MITVVTSSLSEYVWYSTLHILQTASFGQVYMACLKMTFNTQFCPQTYWSINSNGILTQEKISTLLQVIVQNEDDDDNEVIMSIY